MNNFTTVNNISKLFHLDKVTINKRLYKLRQLKLVDYVCSDDKKEGKTWYCTNVKQAYNLLVAAREDSDILKQKLKEIKKEQYQFKIIKENNKQEKRNEVS